MRAIEKYNILLRDILFVLRTRRPFLCTVPKQSGKETKHMAEREKILHFGRINGHNGNPKNDNRIRDRLLDTIGFIYEATIVLMTIGRGIRRIHVLK